MFPPRGKSVATRRYDLLAQTKSGGFVVHVALAAAANDIARTGDECAVFEWGPPLALHEAGSPEAATLAPDVVARMELSLDDVRQLNIALSDLRTRCKEQLPFIAMPPWSEIADRESGLPCGYRFSCVGFVAWLFHAGLELDIVDLSSLPETSFALVTMVYPAAANERARQFAGLHGVGPWRILLPGHVLHAYKAGRGAIPHKAEPQHSYCDGSSASVVVLSEHWSTDGA